MMVPRRSLQVSPCPRGPLACLWPYSPLSRPPLHLHTLMDCHVSTVSWVSVGFLFLSRPLSPCPAGPPVFGFSFFAPPFFLLPPRLLGIVSRSRGDLSNFSVRGRDSLHGHFDATLSMCAFRVRSVRIAPGR